MPKRATAASRERDVAEVRRVEARRRACPITADSSVSSPISTSWPLRAPAALSAASSSSSSRRLAETRKPRSVRKMRYARGRRLRPVDEEVRQLGASSTTGSGCGRAELEQRALELVDARAGRAGERERRATIRSSSSRNAGGSGQQVDLVQDDDLRPLVEAGAVRGELARRSCAKRSSTSSSDASITCRSRRARSRCARNSWPRPTPSLAPSIRPGHVGDGELARRPGDSTVPSTGCERRERVVGDLRLRVRDAGAGATTCPRSAGRRAPRRRAASAAARARPPRRAARSRRSAASGASASRSACCRGRRGRRGRRRRARPDARGRRSARPRRRTTCVPTGTRELDRRRRRRRACARRGRLRRGPP